MHYPTYLAHVRDRLLEEGFTPLDPPGVLSPNLPMAVQREEAWGRLVVALAGRMRAGAGVEPREVVEQTALWARELAAGEEAPCYVVVVFPFAEQVPDELSMGIRALREEDPAERWGVIPWVVDLEVELVDRHVGFPHVGDEVARALTEVPRGAVEETFRRAMGPHIGRRSPVGLRLSLDEVPVTRLILAGTITYYLWTVLVAGGLGAGLIAHVLAGPGSETLIAWGANETLSVLAFRQQWRLLSHVLLHGNLLHLGFNMYALWNLGRQVELLYGSGRMLFIYLVAGVAGGFASVSLRPGPVLSVGASGAILGLMGALIYFAVAQRGRQVDWRALSTPVVMVLLYGLILPRIDNYAHIGGLAGGALGACLAGIPGERKRWRAIAMAVTGLVILALLTGLVPLPSVLRLRM